MASAASPAESAARTAGPSAGATPAADSARWSAMQNRSESAEIFSDAALDVPSTSGYLMKMTRDGRWQKRWFETNGCFLTYYRSKKMEQLLAALNLFEVGAVAMAAVEDGIDADLVAATFSIQLPSRKYFLRVKDAETARRWVRVLNELRAAGETTGTGPAAGVVASDAEDGGPSLREDVKRIDAAAKDQPTGFLALCGLCIGLG